MKNLKMQSLYRCKKRTSQYGAANYPVSCSAEEGQILKFEEIRDFLSPQYRVCTKAIIISKGSYVNEEPKNVIFCIGAKSALHSTWLHTTRFHASPNRANMEI